MPVVVVTAGEDGQFSCATSTTNYVSVQPPILVVALAPASRTARLGRSAGRFSVSVLGAGQGDVAQRAGRRADGPDKLAAVGIAAEQPPAGVAGPPGVAGAAAVLWCQVSDWVTVGDHEAVFGLVTAYRGGSGAVGGGAYDAASGSGGLLLRHQRRYLVTGAPVEPPIVDGYPL